MIKSIPVITLAPGYAPEDKAAAEKYITAFVAGHQEGLVLPPGADFKTVEVNDSNESSEKKRQASS